MFRKIIFGSILTVGVMMMTPMLARAGSDGTGTIDVTVHVDNFAEWGDAANSYTIAASDFVHDTTLHNINLVNQTTTATRNLTLYTNVNATITATAGAHSGILKDATATYSLTTKYSISGAEITPTTAGLLTTTAFFDAGNTYALAHAAGTGSYTVTLTITATSPAAAAPEAGDYTCGLALTATWTD
jgi:hypothetical protein